MTIHGAMCNVFALPGKYIDISFEDEVMVTASVIESLINSMYAGSYYALRILTKSENFLETLKTNFGFTNGIYWSNRAPSPLAVVFQQLFPSDKKVTTENGDIVYHTGEFSPDAYTVPVGFADGSNVLVHAPYSPFRVLNPAWGVEQHFDERVAFDFPQHIQDYFIENQLSLMASDKLISGGDSFHLVVNPYNDGITITGPASLTLSSNMLVCYNGVVNIPYTEKCEIIDNTWKLSAALLEKSTAFIFTHQHKRYICLSDIRFITEVALLPAGSFEVVTPIGQHQDGSSITVLNYFLQRSDTNAAVQRT